MKKLKKLCMIALIVILALGTIAAGCAEEEKYLIGFSTRTLTNEPFHALVLETIEKAVRDAGHEVVTMTTDTGSDAAQQVTQLEDMINMGCDAIIYVPIDGTSSIEVLRTCSDKNIPVVLIDGVLEDGYEDLYVTLIATDNYQAGYALGEYAASIGITEGQIICCRGPEGNLACDNRVNGFIDAMTSLTEVTVAAERYTEGNNESTMNTVQQMLAACPEPVAFFCAADVWVEGGVLALEEAGLDDVAVFAVDGSETGISLLMDGVILADAQQNPRLMATKSVEIVLSILNGETTADDYEDYIDSGITLVTMDNAEEAMENAF